MSILRYKNSNGQWTELPLLEGPPGMSAYEHAVAGGYDGTLEEFEELLNAVVNIDEAEELGIDGNPIENSNNLITSGGVYSALNDKVDKISGKGLSTNDYDTTAKAKVDAIPSTPKYTDTIYDDTAIKSRVSAIEGKEAGWDAKQDAISDLSTIRSGAALGATAVQPQAGKGLFSGNYNDLTNKPTIPSAVTESTVSGWGFTKNTGTISTIDEEPSDPIGDDLVVESVNGKTGAVTLNASDVGALPANTVIPSIDGLATEAYVNSKLGDVSTTSCVAKSGDTMTGKLVVPQIETGENTASYFQSRKFRGEGDADSYYHAIDFGYANHDRVDFYEYGGIWNFWKNTSGTANGGIKVGSIESDGWHGGAVLSGTPTAPTAAKDTNTTQIATTAFVQSAIDDKINSVINSDIIEVETNKVTSISSESTDTQYPSAKAVYDFIMSLDGNGVAY